MKERITSVDTAALVSNAKKNHLGKDNPSQPCSLISDAGSENTNNVVREILAAEPVIIMRIAKREIWGSNAMVESFFKTLKHQWLCYQKIRNSKDLQVSIATYIEIHNNDVPYDHLGGSTPREVLHGHKLMRHTGLTNNIKDERIASIQSCRYCHPPKA